MSDVLGIVAVVFFGGFFGLFVWSLLRMASDGDQPRIVQPEVTSLEARRKLLEKAEAEADFWTQWGRG